eukprot:1363087-Prymnesium_polylepis.1
MAEPCPFGTLGVPRTATEAQIKEKYRDLGAATPSCPRWRPAAACRFACAARAGPAPSTRTAARAARRGAQPKGTTPT